MIFIYLFNIKAYTKYTLKALKHPKIQTQIQNAIAYDTENNSNLTHEMLPFCNWSRRREI